VHILGKRRSDEVTSLLTFFKFCLEHGVLRVFVISRSGTGGASLGSASRKSNAGHVGHACPEPLS